MPSAVTYSDLDAAQALADVLGNNEWVGVQLAKGALAVEAGDSANEAAEKVFREGPLSRVKCRELLCDVSQQGFLSVLTPRADLGSSVNPITKLFPATVTEQRFIEELDRLHARRAQTSYRDDRESGHTLSDFTLDEGELELQINIKNAGTRFERAMELVGIAPDDCIPIPAYKANAAVERMPNLLYSIAVDYTLAETLNRLLPELLGRGETIVWDVLSRFTGSKVRKAEDAFIWSTVNRHWPEIDNAVSSVPFHVVSARKAVTILAKEPKRTPGIGMRAWGNRASAEVNVHLSISEDTTPWSEGNYSAC